jgi:hypothetical protein
MPLPLRKDDFDYILLPVTVNRKFRSKILQTGLKCGKITVGFEIVPRKEINPDKGTIKGLCYENTVS